MQTVADSPRTHDIVLFDPMAVEDQRPPTWVADSLKTAPFAVVRRALPIGGTLPIGIRGVERHQRWGGWLAPSAIRHRWRPEDLIAHIPTIPPERLAIIPALQGVRDLATTLDPTRWQWGPTGSVGFELVSGQPTAKPTSDLDLILRCDTPLDRDDARWIARCLQKMPVRCDMLIETPFGAFALQEYAGNSETVVVRTSDGPRIDRLPWRKGKP